MSSKYKLSRLSKKHLKEAHEDLQKLFLEVSKHIDIRIIEGHRGKDEQNRLYEAGKSKLKWPKSKHNQTPSLALDVIPFPVDWNDYRRFYQLVGVVKGIASQMKIDIRCGADWDGDNEFNDQTFHDLPHFELLNVGKKK